MEKPAPTCMPSWHHPSPLTIPELRRDICHLWVLKCESQNLWRSQLPSSFKTCRVSSRRHRTGPCPETADAPAKAASRTHQGFQSQSQAPLVPCF